jgi:hypothetical protein
MPLVEVGRCHGENESSTCSIQGKEHEIKDLVFGEQY